MSEPRIVVRRELWGKGASVIIEPRRIDRPSSTLPTVGAALRFAEELGRERNLPIVDETGERSDG